MKGTQNQKGFTQRGKSLGFSMERFLFKWQGSGGGLGLGLGEGGPGAHTPQAGSFREKYIWKLKIWKLILLKLPVLRTFLASSYSRGRGALL